MTYVNGYVNKVETVGGPALAALPEGGENGGGRTIELTLVPWTWLLSKRADCAVFQQQDVPGLLAHFLDERPFSAYRMPLGRDYPRAPFFIQYRETDLNFLQRLAEHVGLTMSFTHGPVGHELVFLDLAKDHHFDGTPTVLDAKNTTDVHRTSDLVTEQFVLRASQTGATASVLEGTSASRGAAPERLRMYDFEGSAERQEDVSFYAQLREDEQKSSGGRLRARVHGQPVRSGDVVTLTQSESLNGSYLVVAADMQIGLSSEGTEVVLDVGIDARPASEAFRPERRTPWPIVNGPQIAQVVESSARDSSRVKVRFQWVRDGRAASDLWLPITREALGLRSTMPAAGSEVLVDFLEGEPGRPIVVGVVSK
jgi:type VI secretion system secreted protein VgrG